MPKRSRSPWRPAGALGWLEGESQAEHGDSSRGLRGAAGDASTQRATADHQRQVDQITCAQALGDGDPGGVELRPPTIPRHALTSRGDLLAPRTQLSVSIPHA
jgi:hypothetical protein